MCKNFNNWIWTTCSKIHTVKWVVNRLVQHNIYNHTSASVLYEHNLKICTKIYAEMFINSNECLIVRLGMRPWSASLILHKANSHALKTSIIKVWFGYETSSYCKIQRLKNIKWLRKMATWVLVHACVFTYFKNMTMNLVLFFKLQHSVIKHYILPEFAK